MKAIFVSFALTALVGCASTVPDTQIKHPLSVRPTAPALPADNNGAIFAVAESRARPGMGLFEDRRAKRIGDILTVNLVEKTSATRSSASSDERKANGSISVPMPVVLGKNVPGIGATTWEPAASNKIELKDNDTNGNTVSGSITVTVVDILPNGNLLVAGEKQVRINQDTEYIRLGGVVNPSQITALNSINSTQLADVQLESTSSQRFDKSQLSGMLARFFLTLLPF